MILKLSVNNQSVESSGITKDYKDALCEYVWNSFEANATAVAIDCIPNELTGSAEIVITDNGDGIAYDSLERTFGAFLDSQKNSRSLQIKTKANKGKGRFSCFSFASLAEWSTVTATPDGNIAYTISLENADKNQCDVSDPAPTTRSTGTRLIISGIDGICEDDVTFAQLEDTMLKAFAWYANERDHVQKIVEQHYWLFGEQYHLVTADKRMQKALEEYLYLLYGDKAPNPVLTPDEEELRRMDIFACAARNTEDANGSAIQENLVVELKAPKVVLTKAVLRQIEDYMDYVRKQPLFNSQYRRWKFIAVCSAVDDDVKARYDSQKSKGKKGLVAEIDNYEVYALTWDDVFQSFDLRHAFLLDKLKMDKEAIAAEIAQTAGDEKSKDTADALTALVAN